MICCDTSALMTRCDLIVMKHTAKRNCAEYSDVMLQHRLFFLLKHLKPHRAIAQRLYGV